MLYNGLVIVVKNQEADIKYVPKRSVDKNIYRINSFAYIFIMYNRQ